jgi:hypothetical protein
MSGLYQSGLIGHPPTQDAMVARHHRNAMMGQGVSLFVYRASRPVSRLLCCAGTGTMSANAHAA